MIPTLLLAAAAAVAQPSPPPAGDAANPLVDQARRQGATEVTAMPAPDGGITLGGKLDGDRFAVAIPRGWKGEAMVYAHGYSTPGMPIAVATDPIASHTGEGIFGLAYQDGVAAGHSAYDKAGFGVETGALNTKRLRDFLMKLGARRVYVVGDSMGGNIVVTLLERYPGAFAGGLARCGVVDGWKLLLGRFYDMRAAYNFLTAGTPYALPGVQDVRRSAFSPVPPADFTGDRTTYVLGQMAKIAAPVLALWNAAQKDPGGREARIVAQVAAIGGYADDAASLAYPLATIALGADDIAATSGGLPYGNIGKVYADPSMTPAEAAALNAGIQRISASPRALAYITKWHQATGRLPVPLVTMHNSVDALVPFAQETALKAVVANAGQSARLATYPVPPLRAPLPLGGVEGYSHCGFTPSQVETSWKAFHGWMTTGKRPAADAVK